MVQQVEKKARIPHGVADIFNEEAAAVTVLERRLHELFVGWGYARIIPPTFEYYDLLAIQASEQLQSEMFRFFDREGHILALRPDMTVPTARIAGSKLQDGPLPKRFYYIGHVFRYEEPQAGKQREFTQAGIELLGADTPSADAEVIAVTIETLRQLGFREFQINLGHIGYLAATLAETGLADEQLRVLEQLIDRRNPRDLAQALDSLGIDSLASRTINTLPYLSGDASILAEARSLAMNQAARAAVDRLGQVCSILEQTGLSRYVIVDLGEVRNMDYYTGIVYRGYISGLGFPVCGGGRYDGLLTNFGASMPAVGFAISLERAMSVTRQREPISPDVLVQGSLSIPLAGQIALLRKMGLRVEVDVLDRDSSQLMVYGRQRQARRILIAGDAGYVTICEGDAVKKVSFEQMDKELDSWKH
jgi:ATP phosphoribosyltransferase regulatory subunit